MGNAEVISPDHPEFDELAFPLLKMTGGNFPIRHVISVGVERVSPILAPSYIFFPDRNEREMQEDAYRTYGVQPVGSGR